MSIGPLGSIGSFATTGAAQRTSDTEKTTTATSEQARAEDSIELTEKAAGIGDTKEESEASDRDADGRRIWEVSQREESSEENPDLAPDPKGKDPTGTAGGQLDLSG
jgi:erythromycin esterase-like protein